MPINLLDLLKQIFGGNLPTRVSRFVGTSSLACAIATSMALALAPSDAAGDTSSCPTPTFTFNQTAHDGTLLVTDVYLKSWTLSYPVLVMRGGPTCVPPSIWTPTADYNLVVQRNTAANAFLFSDDQEDGQALLAAIDQQPWSNGRIAMSGWSGSGIVDYLAAPGAGAYLRGISTTVATGDLLNYGLFNGGVLHRETADVYGYAEGTPWEDYVGLPIWNNYLITNNDAQSAHVAGLHVGGWFDVFGQGTLDSFSRLQTAVVAGRPGRQKVVISPRTHAGDPGQLTFPSPTPSNPSIQDYSAAWKQAVFHDNWTAWDALPAVKVYHMGASPGTEWRTYATWPPPGIEYPLYFASGGSLSSNILPSPGQVAFTSNPSSPCPTRGGTNNLISCVPELRPGGTCGPYDQRTIEARQVTPGDVEVFTSLPGGATIVGRIHADVWIQTDLPDVDVFVRMTDVYPAPDNRSMLMAQGIQRARYRNGTCPEPLDLSQPTRVRVDLGSTALVIPTGHKVRVIVSASAGVDTETAEPLYSINPQNGDEYIGAHANRTGSITVLFGGTHASALYIPVPTGQTPPPDRRPNTQPCPP